MNDWLNEWLSQPITVATVLQFIILYLTYLLFVPIIKVLYNTWKEIRNETRT
jgi:cellobiose-specific phosphotransferase system component IIC